MRVFGYMRFSYAGQSDARATRIGLATEELAKALYEPRRMERRFFLFENLCLPSIARQANQNFRLVILASKIMPDIYKDRLAEVTAPIPQIEILYGDGQHVTDVFNPRIAEMVAGIEGPTAHFRLDDDDAIGRNMTARLEAATALAPMVRIVTYPSGLYLSHQEGESYLLREYFPNIGIGMAFLNMPGQIQNPYQCQHVAVSRSTPTFSDPVPLAYIHTAHASSDTLVRQETKFRKMLAAAHDRDAPGNLKRIRVGLRQEFPGVTIEALKALIAEASAI
jgi:Putative rhamnosyl transferase